MNIETVWNNIKLYEGETFYTKRGREYTYSVYSDFLMVNEIKSGRITKNSLVKTLNVDDPTPGKIGLAGCWGNPYIYGIITDKRIKGF